MDNRTNKRNRSFRPDPATIPADGRDIELATIEYLGGMTGDVTPASSPGVAVVLARRQADRIASRVEVDGGCETHERTPTTLPLTFGELIALIDESCNGVALWDYLRAEGYGSDHMPRFRVSSDVYPMLRSYFAQRAVVWVARGGRD